MYQDRLSLEGGGTGEPGREPRTTRRQLVRALGAAGLAGWAWSRSATASAPRSSASKIMVIRHAEKPPDSGPPDGVTIDGTPDSESLIVRGWQRAGALVCLFAPTHGPLQDPALATPQHLFASASVSGHGGSRRPLETITPLAQKLGLTPTTFKREEIDQVVAAAQARGGTALISWQHDNLPAIANRILGDSTTAPQHWPGSRFDVVWVFDLDPGSHTWQFRQVPQCLLSGDRPEPISAS